MTDAALLEHIENQGHGRTSLKHLLRELRIDPRPRTMKGIGEKLSAPLKLPKFPAVMINPGVALASSFHRFGPS